MNISRLCELLVVLILVLPGPAACADSICFGTPRKGRIAGAAQLPDHGINYVTYSSLGVTLGRTYVHSRVRDAMLASYSALVKIAPDKIYVYGETGWQSGGKFKPHRTHQNGLSVDFFVPVTDVKGRSVALPTNPLNKFGYAIEFDANGQYQSYSIDFEALGEHLYQLSIATKKAGSPISRVIFDPPYLPRLFATKHGAYLQSNVFFMQSKAWVRHDEHYHVDFSVPCSSDQSR